MIMLVKGGIIDEDFSNNIGDFNRIDGDRHVFLQFMGQFQFFKGYAHTHMLHADEHHYGSAGDLNRNNNIYKKIGRVKEINHVKHP